jgi:hypothetical protein
MRWFAGAPWRNTALIPKEGKDLLIEAVERLAETGMASGEVAS